MSEEQSVRGQNGHAEPNLRAAIPRDQAGRELRVGVFVLAGLVAVGVSLFLMTDPGTLRGRYVIVTPIADAGGIRKGDPVLMRGVNIGRINDFSMTLEGEVDISLEIDGQWRIPKDSRTQLAGVGLFGGRNMVVLHGTSLEMVVAGDTIAGTGEAGGMIESAEALGQTAEGVLAQVRKVLDDPTVNSVRSSASELQGLLEQLRSIATLQRDELATLTASLNRSATGIEAAAGSGPDIARLVVRTDSAVVALHRTSTTLDRAVGSLEVVLGRMEAGEGTLGLLSKDDSLYVSLNRTMEEIRLLVADLRANPRKYLNLELF
jgi:phospholipid/cholesterol/gamma-HCH transport system substrate-binding protein